MDSVYVAANVDASGAIAETQARLEAMCAEQGHLTSTTIDVSKPKMREIRHTCQRCGNAEIRTLSVV